MSCVGARSSAWRQRNGLSNHPFAVMAKATEELGEVARALIGEQEARPGRGDLVREAAQTIIVLASLVWETHRVDVIREINDEMQRMGA